MTYRAYTRSDRRGDDRPVYTLILRSRSAADLTGAVTVRAWSLGRAYSQESVNLANTHMVIDKTTTGP